MYQPEYYCHREKQWMSDSEWLRLDIYSVSESDQTVLSICNMKRERDLSVPSNLKVHERETPASKQIDLFTSFSENQIVLGSAILNRSHSPSLEF